MRGLADAWEKSFEKNSFHTDHYIVLSVDKDAGRVGMEEASQLTLAALTPFKPELLTSASGESPLKILGRSEEHTSELQSLMRTSYAVFCSTQQTTQQTQKAPPTDKLK